MKVFVENLRVLNNGGMQGGYIALPNGDIDTAITDIVGMDVDYVFTDYECDFGLNLLKYDVVELNNLMQVLDSIGFNLEDNINQIVFKLLVEELSTFDEVENVISSKEFYVYENVNNMGDVARQYLENTSFAFSEVKAALSEFETYFDFESYGEEVLNADNRYLQDEDRKIIVEVYY